MQRTKKVITESLEIPISGENIAITVRREIVWQRVRYRLVTHPLVRQPDARDVRFPTTNVTVVIYFDIKKRGGIEESGKVRNSLLQSNKEY